MLSLYYVTYPVSDSEDTATMQQTPDSTMTQLEKDLRENHEQEMQQATEIIASSQTDTQQKQQQLNTLEQIRQSSLQEELIVQSLADSNIPGCLAEIEEQVIRVICPEQNEGQIAPSEILKVVSGYCNHHQTMELRFD